jgi:hypothetical protein
MYFHIFFSKSLISGLKEKILQIVKDNPQGHFFLDEVPLAELKITAGDMKEISEKIPEENYFWFACQSQLLPQQQEQDLIDCGNPNLLSNNYVPKMIISNNAVQQLLRVKTALS